MQTGIRQGGLVTTDQLDQVAAVAAQQNAMERSCAFLPHGSRLFLVESGWESAMMMRDPSVAQCESLLELEAALRQPDTKVVFIPLGAMMSNADIEKLCQRNGVAKTLFKEVEKK